MHSHRRLPHLVLACVATLASCGGDDAASDATLIHTVRTGDLSITVRERGELHAERDTRVSSELEGRNTLIFLIPEGTVVEAGEKVAELDASLIDERRTAEAIIVARTEAAVEQARKSFEIMEKELSVAANTAESRLKIAEMRAEKLIGQPLGTNGNGASTGGTNADMIAQLRELLVGEEERHESADLVERVLVLFGPEENLVLKMGEMANLILQQINEISLARADVELAANTLRHSEELAGKGFITKNELDKDIITHQRQLSALTLAWNNLELLVDYTLPESLITTAQEVENARLGLEGVRGTNAARRVREAAELRSAEAELDLAQERLDTCEEQIEKAVMYSPGPGLVVYGRWDWDEPVYEGMEVRERQEVVILPDVSTMIAELKVHEAQIDKVAPGQLASVKVDAFPDRSFPARVSHVSTLPDPAPSYRRDVKVYEVRVVLDVDNGDGTLRPGMNATVQIDVGNLRDVVTVPLPALERRAEEHFVWLATPNGPVARPVELGGNNLTHVEVVAGLAPGDRIHLVRPAGVELPVKDAGPDVPTATSTGEETAAAGG